MRRTTIVAITAITLFGALLRLEAVTVKYGWLEHPAWAVRLERALLPVSQALRPSAAPWAHVANPYVGGDPVNYLRFAREMRHFYQAHVREPVFLASTRAMLWLMRGSDIAVSYASMIAGTLAIVATFLVGAAAVSTSAGLIAAAALSIELYAVTWAADGWRDDTFMLTVALCAWTLVRLLQRPTRGWAVASGVSTALACLTRISALSFVVPALVWIGVQQARARESRSLAAIATLPAVVALGVMAVLVAPFLINCWRATGDPFFAINYHTRYYRAAEGLPPDESVGALEYVAVKLRQRPVSTLDTAGVGLLVFPFTTKWTGFDFWSPHLSALLRWMAVAGMILGLWSREGRLLWLIAITSLLPYAVTWSVGGGGEWRFTQHVYPLYLVAAAASMVLLARGVSSAIARRIDWRRLLRSGRAWHAGAAIAAAGCGWLLYLALPFVVVREALAAGEPVSIGGGHRDDVFFGSRWSRPVGSTNVMVRVAMADRVSLRVPLPRAVDHLLTFRMDGPQIEDPAFRPKITVFLDNQTIGHIRFADDPNRVGAYRMVVPGSLAGRFASRLDLVASHTMRADRSGPRFAWLPGETPVSFYLWYVRVEPRI